MAASKPITWMHSITTSFNSLNNNFGTLLALVLGCFPLDILPYRTMSDYSIKPLPFRLRLLTDRILANPPMYTNYICLRVDYVPAKVYIKSPT